MRSSIHSRRRSRTGRRNLPDSALELIAGRFRSLGEVTRLKLLIALEDGELNVTELVRQTGITQANASRHLGHLVQAGILARRKQGLMVFYRIADPTIFALCEHVCGSLEKRFTEQSEIFGPERNKKG